jgi:hypothetical protein
MLYLFNSAYTPTYLENLYRLIGFPEGTLVDIRYTEGINAPGNETDDKYKNAECIVCYIDRFSESYIYLPFRKGRIKSIKREQERVYYEVELRSHCHSELPSAFTTEIQTIANSPRLTNNDPRYNADGIYCIEGPGVGTSLIAHKDSWSKAVDQIYKTHSFGTGGPALFLITITNNGKHVRSCKDGLKLSANKDYSLTVHYRYPFAQGDGRRRKIQTKVGNEMQKELVVGSVSNRSTTTINFPPLDASPKDVTIETVVEALGSTAKEVRYAFAIPVHISSWHLHFRLFGALLAVTFIDEFRQVHWDFTSADAWFSTFFQFSKYSIVIWALLVYRGKFKVSDV